MANEQKVELINPLFITSIPAGQINIHPRNEQNAYTGYDGGKPDDATDNNVHALSLQLWSRGGRNFFEGLQGKRIVIAIVDDPNIPTK